MRREKLRTLVREYSERNRHNDCSGVYSVTNSHGFMPSTDYFSKEVFSKDLSTYKVVKRGMIAYNPSRINVGSVAVQRERETVIVSPLYVVFSVDESKILPEFLTYFLHSDEGLQQIAANTSGSVRDSLKFSALQNIEINLYSIEEQQEIIAILNKFDKLLHDEREALQKINDLVKSQFIEMFGNPISNERKWELCPLEAVGDVGSSKRIFEREYVKEGIPFFRTKEVVELSKGAQISTELFISEERFAELKKEWGCPRKGDLLISAVGTIGVIWIVDDRSFYFKDGNLLQVRSELNSQFLKYVLEWLIADYKQEMSKGTAYAALTINALKKMKIINVPTSAQEWFSHFVEQTDKSKNGYEMEAAA